LFRLPADVAKNAKPSAPAQTPANGLAQIGGTL
jgi:hypothetical protein